MQGLANVDGYWLTIFFLAGSFGVMMFALWPDLRKMFENQQTEFNF